MSIIFAVLTLFSAAAFANEPAYCDPNSFFKREVKNQYPKVKNVHAFKLGNVTLVGMAVGNSKAVDVIEMAEAIAKVPSTQSYCTWYLNEGDKDAEKNFRHVYVPNPRDLSEQESYEIYQEKLANDFATNALSLASCIDKYNYIGLGCNGMKHRGPTVFGMLLAYSGCAPDHAMEIVNKLWKLNGVPEQNRLAAIKAGYDLGNDQPTGRELIQSKLSGN